MYVTTSKCDSVTKCDNIFEEATQQYGEEGSSTISGFGGVNQPEVEDDFDMMATQCYTNDGNGNGNQTKDGNEGPGSLGMEIYDDPSTQPYEIDPEEELNTSVCSTTNELNTSVCSNTSELNTSILSNSGRRKDKRKYFSDQQLFVFWTPVREKVLYCGTFGG